MPPIQANRTKSTGSTHSTSSSSSSTLDHLSNVRRLKWGIFDIAYEVPSFKNRSQWTIFAGWRNRAEWRDAFGATSRLLKRVASFAFTPLLQYLLCLTWISLAPSLSLYMAFRTLTLLEDAIFHAGIPLDRAIRGEVSMYLVLWLGCALVSSWVLREIEVRKLILGGHLRSHFLPLLVERSLYKEELTADDPPLLSLPSPWGFGEEVPAWGIINDLSLKCRDCIALAAEIVAIFVIVLSIPAPDALVFIILVALVAVVLLLAPSNGVGGVGYTFWTENRHYHRLLALYNIAFDDKYRDTVVKDGLAKHLSEEYRQTSEALGPVRSNLLSLACSLPPPWYWAQAQMVITEHPMALYVLLSFNSLSPTSLISIAVFQYGINSLTQAIDAFRNGQESDSVLSIMKKAEGFMMVIDPDMKAERGRTKPATQMAYTKQNKRGMHISLQHVSLRYPGEVKDALDNVSVSIKAGEFVVIVGVNGSGKSSLLKVMTGITTPTTGEVKINKKALRKYTAASLRQAIAFVTQSEPIYPLSLEENIFIGLGGGTAAKKMSSEDRYRRVAEAAKTAGCDHLLERLGKDTILNPCRVVGQSLRGCGNGDVGKGAYRELKRNDPSQHEIVLSPGEKQRLVLSRYIMRIQHRPETGLVILDEGTSALDPLSEREIVDYMSKIRSGKTMIFVTHRLGSFAQRADRIICMDSGTIVQYGSHQDLLKEEGRYRELFNAQATFFDKPSQTIPS